MAIRRASFLALASSTLALAAGLGSIGQPAGKRFAILSERQLPPVSVPNSQSFGALSPDGKTVLIVRQGALYIRPLESVVEKQILPAESLPPSLQGYWSEWAPDGQAVYYLKLDGSSVDLWRLDLADLSRTRLIKNLDPAERPLASPDGKSILFSRQRKMMLADADGNHERPWCDDCKDRPSRRSGIAWSPDSSQILFADYGMNRTNYTYLYNVAKRQIKKLSTWDGVITSIVWPKWESGVFLSVWHPNQVQTWGSVMIHGDDSRSSVIWYLALPGEERVQITTPPDNYFRIFGSGPGALTLIAQRMPAPMSQWDYFRNWLGAELPSQDSSTVILSLKNRP